MNNDHIASKVEKAQKKYLPNTFTRMEILNSVCDGIKAQKLFWVNRNLYKMNMNN